MEALTDPHFWSNPGHTQAQGLMALTVLVVVGGTSLVSTAASRVRLALARSPKS